MIASQPQLPEKPKRPSRKAHITARNQAGFLAAYAKCGNITAASKAAKVDRCSHRDWLVNDPTYADRFAQAQEQAIDALEAEARKRATTGGSDVLLMFLLNGLKPEVYKRRDRVSLEKSQTQTDEATTTVFRLEFDQAG